MRWMTEGSRRGNYSFLMGGAMIGIMGFAALAVDISLINMAELQVQSTADAASHAALLAYRRDSTGTPAAATAAGTAAAQFMVDRNAVAMGSGQLHQIRFGQYDRTTDTFTNGPGPSGTINAVEVDVTRTGTNAVDLLLAPIFGVTTHDVDGHSVTAQQERAIMLVQDWSCSMNFGSYPHPIDISRRATWGFLNYMVANPQDGDMFGITGYAEFGVGEDYTAVTAESGPPWAQLSIIETQLPYLRQQISRICNSEVGCPDDTSTNSTVAAIGLAGPDEAVIGRCTNPAVAMRQAIWQLTDNTSDAYFRGMLVMSDGEFNCVTGTEPDADLDAQDAANTAYDIHDIHIWPILYHAGSFDAAIMEGLARGYGFAQVSNDASDLPSMYAAVAASLPTAIVD